MAVFSVADDFVKSNEGGFQKNPADAGNYYNGELQGTNWGISAPVARQYGYQGRMEDMPESFAIEVRYLGYWQGLDDVVNQAIATKIYDMRINFGNAGGTKIAQRALNSIGKNVAVDGTIGPETLAAINSADPVALMNALCATMAASYDPSSPFIEGWLDRAAAIPPGLVLAGVLSLAGLGVALLIGLAAARA